MNSKLNQGSQANIENKLQSSKKAFSCRQLIHPPFQHIIASVFFEKLVLVSIMEVSNSWIWPLWISSGCALALRQIVQPGPIQVHFELTLDSYDLEKEFYIPALCVIHGRQSQQKGNESNPSVWCKVSMKKEIHENSSKTDVCYWSFQSFNTFNILEAKQVDNIITLHCILSF